MALSGPLAQNPILGADGLDSHVPVAVALLGSRVGLWVKDGTTPVKGVGNISQVSCMTLSVPGCVRHRNPDCLRPAGCRHFAQRVPSISPLPCTFRPLPPGPWWRSPVKYFPRDIPVVIVPCRVRCSNKKILRASSGIFSTSPMLPTGDSRSSSCELMTSTTLAHPNCIQLGPRSCWGHVPFQPIAPHPISTNHSGSIMFWISARSAKLCVVQNPATPARARTRGTCSHRLGEETALLDGALFGEYLDRLTHCSAITSNKRIKIPAG